MSLRDKNNNPVLVPGKGAAPFLPLGLRRASTEIARPTGAGVAAVEKAMIRHNATPTAPDVGILIDATASRSATWKEAQIVQAQMFDAVGKYNMSLRLGHFGNGRLTLHAWERNQNSVAATMADVTCKTGKTQIIAGLKAFLDDDRIPSCIILVGDAFEENGESEEFKQLLAAFQAKGIKIFAFQEDSCSETEKAFRKLAEATGGAYAKFGLDLSLGDLCQGVALLAAGHLAKLRALRGGQIQKLLTAMP